MTKEGVIELRGGSNGRALAYNRSYTYAHRKVHKVCVKTQQHVQTEVPLPKEYDNPLQVDHTIINRVLTEVNMLHLPANIS